MSKSKKNNYYDDDVVQNVRVKEKNSKNNKNINNKGNNKKSKKKSNAGKNFLIFICFVIIALAVFVATIKIANPNYDFSQLIPQSVADKVSPKRLFDLIDEKIMGVAPTKTTQSAEQSTTESTTFVTTTMSMMDYIEADDFAFNTAIQGSQMGTLLNGGLVSTDASFIYHFVDGKGIYRFVPSTESFALYYGVNGKVSCMNPRGEFIYYVNNKNNNLYKLRKGTTEPTKIAENVKFAYVYDKTIFFVTTTNKVCTMDLSTLIPVTAYYAGEDNEVNFVGISLSRVFFTVTNPSDEVKYLTVDYYGHKAPSKFREDGKARQVKKLQLENGFFYFYQLQNDETYNLCRQKYGSDKIITLVENVTTQNYVEINSNRLYYSNLNNGKYSLHEFNMNTKDDKIMLSVSGVTQDNDLSFYLGGEYNFIIGDKGNGDYVYYGSSIYTSSTNTMKFNNGKWKY